MEALSTTQGVVGSLDLGWVAAIACSLAALAGWCAVAIQRRELRRLRAETRTSWQDAFVTYQRAYFLSFAGILRVAYQRFIHGRRGVPLTWEEATHQARWPRNTPLSPVEPLREWRSRHGIGLDAEDDFLVRFCEAIYPPAEAESLQSPRVRSIMTPDEFDVFDRTRGGIADYFHRCGSWRARSPQFAQFLEHEVRPDHYYRIKIVAYLEIARARALGEFSEAGRDHVGLFELGRTWKVDDVRKEKPGKPRVRRRSA